MAIPLSGATQGNGRPNTFYSYTVETDSRTADSVHVVLKLNLRLQWASSYYSFRIAHECKVNGVYQYADIKTQRNFWGHQWGGLFIVDYFDWGVFGWDPQTYDYDGSRWHGPYTVFDGVVPIEPGDDRLHIVPCITQPPITGLGGWGEVYGPNDQDITNWEGCTGYWRPFGEDEQIGTYANRPCPQDGCFLNNRWLEELGGGEVGVYPYAADVARVDVSPKNIDVSEQVNAKVTASWPKAARADRYLVYEGFGEGWGAIETPGTSISFVPSMARRGEMEANGEVYVSVRSVDSSGVKSPNAVTGGPVTYTERSGMLPKNVYLSGSCGTNLVSSRGEKAVIRYSGWVDGSYPIASYAAQVTYPDGSVETTTWAAPRGSDPKVEQAAAITVRRGKNGERANVSLSATNSKGLLVKASGGALSVSFDIEYVGSGIWVRCGDRGAWKTGPVWVYIDNVGWREARSGWVYDARNKVWRSS